MLARNVITRALPLSRRALGLNTPCVSLMATRLDHHGPPADYKYPTMDEMPVPCGSWQEHYDNNQRKYNIHLLLGVGVFLITVAAGFGTGTFKFYYYMADKPAPRPA